jgi:hypothetical protein
MRALFALSAVVTLASVAPSLPQIGDHDRTLPAKQYVAFVPETQVIPAGKRSLLALHFSVAPNFHINSHTPKSELLLATDLVLRSTSEIKIEPAEFPPGKTFSFSFDPTEKLDVYQGDFIVKVPVSASPGDHELQGSLTYQACSSVACFPPRDFPIIVPFTAK